MRKLILMTTLIIIALIFGIPLVILSGFSPQGRESDVQGSQTVKVLDTASSKIINMPLEEYLVGVVAAEMPANFEPEALKAQAVAARTYTVKRMLAFGGQPNPEHPNAEVCTNPAHCQAWIDETQQKEKWGRFKYFINIERIRAAVKATRGEVITYNSTYIDPVYHGSCGGKGTENSEDVWSYAIPYLRRVSCDKEYRANDQRQTIEIDKKDLAAALIAGRIGVESVSAASTPGEQIIKSLEKTASGRLKEVMIYGQKVSGTDLRKVLGLSSTFMSWQDEGSKIKVTSIGKGHAVGLCQYGANGMALAGSNYKKIVLHYYTGVKIEKLKY